MKSSTNPIWYDVNIDFGICSCETGKDGSPCIHQSVIVQKFGIERSRLKIAIIALGNGAVQQLSFYSSLHQQVLEEQFTVQVAISKDNNFVGTSWNLI